MIHLRVCANRPSCSPEGGGDRCLLSIVSEIVYWKLIVSVRRSRELGWMETVERCLSLDYVVTPESLESLNKSQVREYGAQRNTSTREGRNLELLQSAPEVSGLHLGVFSPG